MSNQNDQTRPSKSGKWLNAEEWEAMKAAGFTEAELYEDHPFGPIIHTYTRKQAIEDGVLMDLTRPGFDRLLKMLGIKIHTVMTATAFGQVVTRDFDSDHAGQAIGNTLMVLAAFRKEVDRKMRAKENIDRVYFTVPGLDNQDVELWALIGPGDEGEPVLTIMLVGED
jgi:hypothetical protein